MSYVEIRGLTKRFGKTIAVDNVNIDVEKGQVFCLLGPSGCGKTTILRIFAGLAEQDSGKICLDGEEISQLQTHERKIGMVFQNWALFPHLTVFENIAFGLRINKLPENEIKQLVRKALVMVRLPEIGERFHSQLSGGQQQRVALARTLVTNPRVLLFDEPLSNLDLKLRQEMRIEIKSIQKELNFTAVYVTHEQGEALSLGDIVAVMRDGKIVEFGSPQSLFGSPQKSYVANFLGVENILPVDVIDGEIFICGVTKTGYLPSETIDQPMEIGIRSEHVSISSQPITEYANHYQAKVQNYDYQGSIVRYIVNLDGTNISLETSYTGSYHFGVGEQVYVGWHDEHVLPLVEN